jgi:hypothetical protein
MRTSDDMRVRQQTDADAVRKITCAADAARTSKRSGSADEPDAQRRLWQTVDDARSDGVSWQTIGDALGMRRGAAYQKYRRRPLPRRPDQTSPQATAGADAFHARKTRC